MSRLEEELDSWKGFPYVMRKNDRDTWDRMIDGVSGPLKEAVEHSGKTFTTDAFFMGLLLAQHKKIRELKQEIDGLRSGSS